MDVEIPPLIPLRPKKETEVNNAELQRSTTGQSNKVAQSKQETRNTGPIKVKEAKIDQIDKKLKQLNPTNRGEKNRGKDERDRENERSKLLIAEMLNKISAKNISEQLQPISNQNIQSVLSSLANEVDELEAEAEKKQSALQANPHNKHVEKQLENIKKSISSCMTIRELYNEKINFRNRIRILEEQVIELREENKDLKIKVHRGIEKIESHMHNLPCQREKELKEQLNKCTQELIKEHEMRISLERNIDEIITNFKRLYDDADNARLVVINKLKEIEERQRKLRLEERNQSHTVSSRNETEEQPSPKLPAFSPIEIAHSRKWEDQNMSKTPPKGVKVWPKKPLTTAETQKAQPFTDLNEQIKKMRNNQLYLGKIGRR